MASAPDRAAGVRAPGAEPVSIRLGTASDIAAVKAIADRDKHALGFVHRASLDRAVMRDELVVAMADSAIVGFCHLYYRRDGIATVYHVAVRLDARGAGVGRALLAWAAQDARDRGMAALRLKCPADLPANDFYARLGFDQITREANGSRPLNLWELRWRTQSEACETVPERLPVSPDDRAAPDDGLERVVAADRSIWRAWLEANGETASAVWLVYAKKGSGRPSITWDEAVEEALCFGWIDSKAKPIDAHSYMQYFSPRKPASVWSRINKARLERLIAAGLMREPGLRAIEAAKANGSWSLLDEVEALVIPDDLGAAFAAAPDAASFFAGLSRSSRRNILQWIATAKRPATRANRIAATIAAAARGELPIPGSVPRTRREVVSRES